MLRLHLILVFSATFILGSCGQQTGDFKVAVATFSHETCTFCPGSTTIDDWEQSGPPTRDLIRSNSGYIGGFKRLCDEFGGVELRSEEHTSELQSR